MKDPQLTKLTNKFLSSVKQMNECWNELRQRDVYVQAKFLARNEPSRYSAQYGVEITDITEPVDYLTGNTKPVIEITEKTND